MINSFAGNSAPETVAEAVARDGYAVVRDAVAPGTVAAVSADLAPFLEDAHKGHEEFFGTLTKRFGALLATSSAVVKRLWSKARSSRKGCISAAFSSGFAPRTPLP